MDNKQAQDFRAAIEAYKPIIHTLNRYVRFNLTLWLCEAVRPHGRGLAFVLFQSRN